MDLFGKQYFSCNLWIWGKNANNALTDIWSYIILFFQPSYLTLKQKHTLNMTTSIIKYFCMLHYKPIKLLLKKEKKLYWYCTNIFYAYYKWQRGTME